MTNLQTLAAIPALALSLALAGPALAQEAAATPAPQAAPAPASPEAAANDEEAAEAHGQRSVSGRDLMTAEERRSFRRQMQQATPEQRQQLWAQKHAELAQRAAARGLVLAEPGSRHGGNGGESQRGGREGSRGEARGVIFILAPRAP